MSRLRLLVGFWILAALWIAAGSAPLTTGASTPVGSPTTAQDCPVTQPSRQQTFDADTPGNFGTSVQAGLYPAGVLPVRGFWVLPDGSLPTKLPFWWEPSLGSELEISITSVDIPNASGRVEPMTEASNDPAMHETLDGRWMFQAWRLIFPREGCWRIIAQAGTDSLTFVAKVVAPTIRDTPPGTPSGGA
jgi:hypothetical protein